MNHLKEDRVLILDERLHVQVVLAGDDEDAVAGVTLGGHGCSRNVD